MADCFIGEIRLFAGNFAPEDWHFCDGSLLPIAQYDALFALLGTTYGGDGHNNFALPDLRGRVPVSQGTALGSTYVIGQGGGAETVSLTAANLPAHNHPFPASSAEASLNTPAGNLPASAISKPFYVTDATGAAAMAADAVATWEGGTQAHANVQPFQAINYIIALNGIFPQQA